MRTTHKYLIIVFSIFLLISSSKAIDCDSLTSDDETICRNENLCNSSDDYIKNLYQELCPIQCGLCKAIKKKIDNPYIPICQNNERDMDKQCEGNSYCDSSITFIKEIYRKACPILCQVCRSTENFPLCEEIEKDHVECTNNKYCKENVSFIRNLYESRCPRLCGTCRISQKAVTRVPFTTSAFLTTTSPHRLQTQQVNQINDKEFISRTEDHQPRKCHDYEKCLNTAFCNNTILVIKNAYSTTCPVLCGLCKENKQIPEMTKEIEDENEWFSNRTSCIDHKAVCQNSKFCSWSSNTKFGEMYRKYFSYKSTKY
ncbi:hypothetical protein SNEBB_006343 [Seison nebaliae]|nr:hypothetical protein SNEBB_006343 [Seison nebaliae]